MSIQLAAGLLRMNYHSPAVAPATIAFVLPPSWDFRPRLLPVVALRLRTKTDQEKVAAKQKLLLVAQPRLSRHDAIQSGAKKRPSVSAGSLIFSHYESLQLLKIIVFFEQVSVERNVALACLWSHQRLVDMVIDNFIKALR